MMQYFVKVEFKKDFINVNGNNIVVGITSRPEKGKANMEIIKKVADYFHVSSKNVRLVSGFKSRNKIIEVLEEKQK
ncbi:MAG: DUF167 domain-containing protein [archaeon]